MVIYTPKDVLVEFLRARLTDPRGRHTLTSDSFTATAGDIANSTLVMNAIRDDREFVTHDDFFKAMTKVHIATDAKSDKDAQEMYS